jgi:hypothetical protein
MEATHRSSAKLRSSSLLPAIDVALLQDEIVLATLASSSDIFIVKEKVSFKRKNMSLPHTVLVLTS